MTVKTPNQPDAVNPAITPPFQIGRQWRGVTDPHRKARSASHMTALAKLSVLATCTVCLLRAADFPKNLVSIDTIMSKEDQVKTGVASLSAEQRAALEQWLSNFAVGVATQVASRSTDPPSTAGVIPVSRNPKLTSSVNPKLTSSINPELTSRINPALTSSLNPDLTSSINPELTSSLNPQLTSSINPQLTASLNPELTTSLDPTRSKWSGYYAFDLDADFVGVVVRVPSNPRVMLYFKASGEWVGYFISNGKGGFNWFDLKGNWIGYVITNSKESFNIFNRKTEWNGYLT